MQLYAYEYFGVDPNDIARRTVDLLEFLVRTKSEATREYLQRVARCYIYDMGPELAVMARAVMEAALEDETLALEERAKQMARLAHRDRPVLADWIEAASGANLLSVDARIAADGIRNEGNDTIHSLPQTAPESRDLLERLHLVLTCLEDSRKAR